MDTNYIEDFIIAASKSALNLEQQADKLEIMVTGLGQIKTDGGRLFIIGSGGGAGHASHAVCDFRKLCGIESYAPTDNVSELTARTNDDGWDTTLSEWLKISKINASDGLLVFSVGGGSKEHNISMNLVNAMELAQAVGAKIFSIVGKDNGVAAEISTACIVIEAPADKLTPLAEGYQAVVWHMLVSHPSLAAQQAKWESVTTG